MDIVNWEYWPGWAVYLFVYIYIGSLMLRFKSKFFFALANPSIEFGGLYGEKKDELLASIPNQYKAKSILYTGQSYQEITEVLGPEIIIKPNQGEKGQGIFLIDNETDFNNYFQQQNFEVIIQEYLSDKVELAVMYYRFPNDENGFVEGITEKVLPVAVGDGESTLRQLCLKNHRFNRQNFDLKGNDDLVLAKGEEYLLSIVGNHIRGAKFLDAVELLQEKHHLIFDQISKTLGEVYCVRYDIKAKSKESFVRGEFKIVEVNGVGAEPTHMYDPKYGYWSAQKILWRHWRKIGRICHESLTKGNVVPSKTAGKAWQEEVKTYQSLIS